MNMYRHVEYSYPLFMWKRVAFGANTTIRYPDDFFDRLWSPGSFGNDSIEVSSNALFSEDTSRIDSPPPAVLKHAITARSANASIELLMGFPSYEIHVYLNFYFSEFTQLQPNQNRSFRLFKDNKSDSDPVLPPYDDCDQLYVSGTTVSSKTTFSLVPTNVSTLPPLINALEIFQIGNSALTDGTYKSDVEGLASLQDRFDVLKGANGDPCLPAPYTWDWIQCNDDPTPRVTALLLGSYGLLGLLPDFSPMTALQTIDLQDNKLQGPIPFLQTLSLANNQFNGTIPASLATKKGFTLTVAGNPGLCIPNTTSSCGVPATTNSSMKKKKKRQNILELLLAAIIPYMIII